MATIFVVYGKVNYTNLSRYSDLFERAYRRYFNQGLGVEGLNQVLIEQLRSPPNSSNRCSRLQLHRKEWPSYLRSRTGHPI